MSDQPAFPEPSREELPETLKRLGDLVLDLNDHVQDQTKAINHATTAANEARRASKTTMEHTNPEQYAEFAVDLIENRTGRIIDRMNDVASGLIRASNHTLSVLKEADKDRSEAQRRVWEREQRLDRFKSRLPWFGLGAAVLALAMTVTLPRFMASYGSTCAVLGGVWTTTSTGTDVCAFYRE
jgi:hypothetical protein